MKRTISFLIPLVYPSPKGVIISVIILDKIVPPPKKDEIGGTPLHTGIDGNHEKKRFNEKFLSG